MFLFQQSLHPFWVEKNFEEIAFVLLEDGLASFRGFLLIDQLQFGDGLFQLRVIFFNTIFFGVGDL